MQNSDTPLSVRIDDDQLVIRVGIDRLDGHDCHPDFPELPITDRQQWARNVAYELERDRGDGATPVALLLDAAMKGAMEMGSPAIDYKRPTARDIDGEPCLANCGCRRTSSAERLCPEHEVLDRTNSEEFAKQSAETLAELG